MWRAFISEFDYLKMSLSFLLFIIPGFYAFSVWSGKSGAWFVVPSVLTVSLLMQVFINRSLEKRDRQFLLLPISVRRLGVVRLGLVLIPAVAVHFGYILIDFILDGRLLGWHQGGVDELMFFSLTLIGFSAYFMLSDLIFASFRGDSHIGFDVVGLLIVIALIVMGIPITLAVLQKSRPIPWDGIIFGFLAVGLLLLSMTVLTYTRRRTYLE